MLLLPLRHQNPKISQPNLKKLNRNSLSASKFSVVGIVAQKMLKNWLQQKKRMKLI
jgi:hypothetical protein